MKRVQQFDPSICGVLEDCWSLDVLVLDEGFQGRGVLGLLHDSTPFGFVLY